MSPLTNIKPNSTETVPRGTRLIVLPVAPPRIDEWPTLEDLVPLDRSEEKVRAERRGLIRDY